jgi:hypothetical protein
MTFRNKAVTLGSAAGVLLVTLVLGEIFSPMRMSETRAGSLLFPGFKDTAAQKIELSTGTSKVTLMRGPEWTVDIGGTPYPADGSKVRNLFQEVAALARGALITKDPGKAAELGFSGQDSVHLLISGSGGEKLVELYAGKTPTTGRGKYIRVENTGEIYESAGSLSSYLSAERSFWENLKVYPDGLKAENVAGIAIKSSLALSTAKGTRTLDYAVERATGAQGGGAWAFRGGGQADAEKIQSLLNTLISFAGAEFDTSPDAVKTLTSSSRATVAVTTTDGTDFTLLIGARREGDQYPCALRGFSNVYLVPEWRVDQALPARESLTPQAR